MNINWKEPSTKRGIVMAVTGGIVLYQVVFGTGSADVDALVAKVEWWIGVGITVAGLMGVVLPDEPKQPPLPPIELQGSATGFQPYRDPDDVRLHVDLPAPPRPETPDQQRSGWGG